MRRRFQRVFLSSSANRQIVKEETILKAMREVVEPFTLQKLHTYGCIQSVSVNENNVNIVLDTLVPGYPLKAKLEQALTESLKSLSWVENLTFAYSRPLKTNRATTTTASGLDSTLHIIGVSSCKGGVGKSTIAVNLACSLAKLGLSVGILDADVYGPSLPSLLEAVDHRVLKSPTRPNFVLPLNARDLPSLKMLSFAHVNPNSGAPGSGSKGAAVMRGPMASKVMNQLMLATEWGDLDYLIVDMPPGTGDVQITLAQSAQLSGAMVVTTPHRLAIADTAKGVAMFQTVQVPILGVVENMSHFDCEHGTRYYPFGRGGRDRLLKELFQQQSQLVVEDMSSCPYHSLPLILDNNNNEENRDYQRPPIVLASPESNAAKEYKRLAESMILELFRQQGQTTIIPSVSLESQGKVLRLRYFTASSASEHNLAVEQLRGVDPATGKGREIVLKSSTVSIARLELKGRYGVGITWSDGASEIYSYSVLRELVVS